MSESSALVGADRWVQPSAGPSEEEIAVMEQWRRRYRRDLAPVRKEWSRLAAAIQQGRQHDLVILCPDFRHRVGELSGDRLLPSPDPVLNFYLARGLDSLRGAAARCHRRQLFALAHRLSAARSALLQVEERLRRYDP